MKQTLQALDEAGVVDKRDVYLACIIDSNLEVFREVMNVVPEFKERFLEMAEEDGWLVERDIKRDRQRDIQRDIQSAKTIARNFLRLGRPIEEVAEATELPIEMVRTLV